jgi:hypothetical protein
LLCRGPAATLGVMVTDIVFALVKIATILF